MFKKIIRLAKNPTVRKVAIWLGPMILGWIMTKADEKSTRSTTAKKSSKKPK